MAPRGCQPRTYARWLTWDECGALRRNHSPLALPPHPDVRKPSAPGESRSRRVFATGDDGGCPVDPNPKLGHGEGSPLRDPTSCTTPGITGAITKTPQRADESKIRSQKSGKGGRVGVALGCLPLVFEAENGLTGVGAVPSGMREDAQSERRENRGDGRHGDGEFGTLGRPPNAGVVLVLEDQQVHLTTRA